MNTNVINEALQKLRSVPLTTFMQILSFGGTFFMVLIIFYFLYFQTNKKNSFYYLIILFITYGVTQLMKSAFASPRPFRDPGILNLSGETFPSFDHSFPSGHSTIAMTSTMFILLYKRNKIHLPILLYPFLIAFSRLYLGVHRIEDVVVGLMLGFVIPYAIYPIVTKLKFNHYHILASSILFISFFIFISTKPKQHPLTIIIATSLIAITLLHFIEQKFINYTPKNKLLFSLYQLLLVGGIILCGVTFKAPHEFKTGDSLLFYTSITLLINFITLLATPFMYKIYNNYLDKELTVNEISNK